MSKLRPRVILADDHPMMLMGLLKLLEAGYEVVATVTDGRTLLAEAERLRPALVLTDVRMPGIDGIEVTRRLQVTVPRVRVVILSIHAEPSHVQAAFEAGAWGYLPKTSAPEEIVRALVEVLAGRLYISPAVARAALGGKACRGSLPPEAGEALTPREGEILPLLAEGLSNQQIALQLGVTVATIRSHLNSVYEKLGLESRVELALFAARAHGLDA